MAIRPFQPKGGRPVMKCALHGLVEPIPACIVCAKNMQDANDKMRDALQEGHRVLIKASEDLDKASDQLRQFEGLVNEIHAVTHKDYCVDGLHGAMKSGEHHPACQFIAECVKTIQEGPREKVDIGLLQANEEQEFKAAVPVETPLSSASGTLDGSKEGEGDAGTNSRG